MPLCTARGKTGGKTERRDKNGRIVPEVQAIFREQKDGRNKRKTGSDSYVMMF